MADTNGTQSSTMADQLTGNVSNIAQDGINVNSSANVIQSSIPDGANTDNGTDEQLVAGDVTQDPLTAGNDGQDNVATTDPATGQQATPVATARRFRMDLRHYYSYWYRPSMPEIHEALDLVFPDENPIVEEGYSNFLMSFTIHLNKYLPIEPGLFVRFRRPVCYKAILEDYIDVPLQPLQDRIPREGGHSGPGNRSEGILLTLLNAAVISRDTPNEAFDAAFSKLGTVTKPCEFQRDLKYRRFNKNRYLIVKFNDGVKIPDTITVTDPTTKRNMQYRVRYANQTWQCGRCDLTHTGKCPKAQKLRECDKVKDNETLSTHIIGDSTIRHLEQRALKAEVASMPGGTLGQLTSIAFDHPDIQKTADTIIVGGTNDILVSHDEAALSTEDRIQVFTHTAHSLFKIIKLGTEGNDPPKINFVLTSPNDETLTPEESIRKDYLFSGLENLAYEHESINVVAVQDKIEKTVDGHPTCKGTGELLDSFLGGADIVIDRDVALHPKPYRGVQRMWKQSCKSCSRVGVYDRFDRCTGCFDTMRAMMVSKDPTMETWVNQYMALLEARDPKPSSSDSPTAHDNNTVLGSVTPRPRSGSYSDPASEFSQAKRPRSSSMTLLEHTPTISPGDVSTKNSSGSEEPSMEIDLTVLSATNTQNGADDDMDLL